MQCIAMAQTSRIKTTTVVVDRRRAVNDLISAVAIDIGNTQVVISLSTILPVLFVSIVTVKGPEMRELAASPVPCGEN